MDQLAKDMIQCKADGYGCYYGRWHAAVKEPQMAESEQPHPKKAKAAGKAERPRCVICGREIPAVSRRTKTCSPACADALRLRQYQETKNGAGRENCRRQVWTIQPDPAADRAKYMGG